MAHGLNRFARIFNSSGAGALIVIHKCPRVILESAETPHVGRAVRAFKTQRQAECNLGQVAIEKLDALNRCHTRYKARTARPTSAIRYPNGHDCVVYNDERERGNDKSQPFLSIFLMTTRNYESMQYIKGFTLIELLIVIVLIGIIGSMTMLSIGSGNQRDRQKQEAERLLQLLQLASQEAIIQGMPVALEYYRHGYRFLMMNNGQWHTETQDALFMPRALHPQLFIELKIEKQAIPLYDQAKPVPDPQIVFTPDGDISLFQVTIGLTGSDELLTVTNTPGNGLVMAAQTATPAL